MAGPFKGHTSGVLSVGFSSDGTRIVSGSADKSIRVWDATPHRTQDSKPFTDWLIDEHGMITTQQGELLLFVPLDLWTGLMRPDNTRCIYRKGALKLDFDGVLLGSDWVGWYQG